MRSSISFIKEMEEEIRKELIHKAQEEVPMSNGQKISGPDYGVIGNDRIAGEAYSEIMEPPLDFEVWAQASIISARLNRCIRTVALNTVGLGYEVVAKAETTKDTPDSEKNQIQEEKDRLKTFLENCNPDMPFNSVMVAVMQDQETLGNGYLEITRNGAGEITGLYHVPALTMRVLKCSRGYVQVTQEQNTTFPALQTQKKSFGRKVYFEKLGMTDEEAAKLFPGSTSAIMNKTNGRFVGEYWNGVDASGGVEPPPSIENRASEILHFKNPNSIDSFYGLPKHISSGMSISGTRFAQRRNLKFFENDAVPRMIVAVSGGKVSKKERDSLTNFFKQGKGVEDSNRVCIIEVEQSQLGKMNQDRSKPDIEFKPMTIGVNEDANFLKYINTNNEEIRETYGLPQIFFRSDDTNKASSAISKKIVDEQEFEPQRLLVEFVLNHKLFTQKPLNIEKVRLVFKRPDTVDLLEKAQALSLLTKSAGITPNDIRKELGKEPFPKDYIFATKPLQIAIAELQMGLSPSTINNPKADFPLQSIKNPKKIKGPSSENTKQVTKPSDGSTNAVQKPQVAKKSLSKKLDVLEDKLNNLMELLKK